MWARFTVLKRHSDGFRDHGLCHSAVMQQHHLDTLALLGMSFPTQRCLQTHLQQRDFQGIGRQ
jgi:hypothetical protein